MIKFLQGFVMVSALVLSASIVVDTLPIFIEVCLMGIMILVAYAVCKLEGVE